MKINQVEELAGITKKNIRFYEEQGLLNPERNPENGYREYTLKDVENLLKVKLLRKLDVPIEEIRKINEGSLSFSECMDRHSGRLKKQKENLSATLELCEKLKGEVKDFRSINASDYLKELNELEKGGAVFVDLEKKDIKAKSMTGAILAGSIFTLLSAAIITGILIAAAHESVPPVILVIFIGMPAITIILTIAVTVQRIKEIRKGEAYDARNY